MNDVLYIILVGGCLIFFALDMIAVVLHWFGHDRFKPLCTPFIWWTLVVILDAMHKQGAL